MHSDSDTAVVLQVTTNAAVEKVSVGVPSDPDAFIERAIAAGHPRSLDQFVDPQIESMIKENFVEEPASLAAKRVVFFKKYLRRAKELRGEEEKLRASMPPHVLALVGWLCERKCSMIWTILTSRSSMTLQVVSSSTVGCLGPCFQASRQEASHVNGDLKDPLQSLECHHLQEHECQARA